MAGSTVTIENAEIIFRNFSGKEGRYNREGQKTFAVIIHDPEVVAALQADEWNVKFLEPREEGDNPTPFLPVEVRYDPKPPNVVMISSSGRTHLDEKTIDALDWADLKTVDIIVNPYDWVHANGTSGRKAYLKTMFVTINEDDLERKYAKSNTPEEKTDG